MADQTGRLVTRVHPRAARSTRGGHLSAVALIALVASSLALTLSPLGAAAAAPDQVLGTAPNQVLGTAPNQVLGVYAGAAYPPAVPAFAKTVGAQPRYAMDFLLGTTWKTITQGRWPYTNWKGQGYTMIWGVNMLPDTYSPNTDPQQAGGSCNGLTQGAKGTFDHYFRTVAENIVRAGFPVSVIRFGWEFNGNWFPWAAQGCAGAFVQYWQHIVTTMRAVPGTHFTFEWNPTRGDLGVGNLAQYYPGNNYVDDIGLDVYDIEQQSYPGAKAEFRHMLTESDGLNWVAHFASVHHKAVMLPEWGLGWGTCSKSGQPISASGQVCGGDDAPWVTLMTNWIAAHKVLEATYWDFGTSTLRRGHNPLTAATLASRFGIPPAH